MSSAPQQIGRYRIIEKIGSGGMGSLYLAHDPLIDRQVAIKVLLDQGDNAEFRERFTREARSAGGLRHVNIVTIYDIGEQDGFVFIVMEYVHGETLARLIAQRAALSLARKLEIVEGMCAGLSSAHRAGIVHRDVKPANVMVASDGVVKILDFGIAHLARAPESGLTQAGTIFGTLNYVSPEMLMGRPVDSRADVFAVGSVLYELVSGRKLFPGTLADGLIARVMAGTHEPLSAAVPGIPPLLEQIVERSIAKDPADRYQDLQTMERDAARCRSELPDTPLIDDAAALAVVGEGAAPEPTRMSIAEPVAMRSPVGSAEAGDGTIFISPPPHAVSRVPEVPAVRLIVARSSDPHEVGRTIEVPSGGLTLGRSADCDVAVNDSGWSRHHARLEWVDRGFVIRDLSSRNGTFVNGRRVRADVPEPLFFGATITVGTTALTFSYGRDTALPDLTGVEVAGRYRLERLLRESAKSAMYAASDRHVPRNVALKLLSPDFARYAGYREQFEREARTAAELQHPYICQVLDSGVTRFVAPDGRQIETSFLCFELMGGGSLSARFGGTDVIELREVSRWIDMLGSALAHAHRQGVVHGDLKPSAIVFDSGEHLYLTDFAIAQKGPVQSEQPMMGSPAFLAPEQWDGAAPTPATDQFAMAALAYYMITGSRPFEGQDSPEIRKQNLRRGPIAAHEEAAQNQRQPVPRAVSEVLRRGLSVAPAGRYPSIELFTGALLKALGAGHVAGVEPLVFVSYDRELSGGWARFFADRLKEKHGIRVFMDTFGLDRAGRFPPRLKRAIEDCDVFICFLAGATLNSKWVSEEVRIAHEFGKTMIPIFQEGYVEPAAPDEASPVGALISHQGIRLFDVSGHFVDHAVTDLANLVKNALSTDSESL